MKEKIGYIKMGNSFLIFRENGSTDLVKSEKEFNEYLTNNNCEIES